MGINGDVLKEGIPEYIRTPSEKVIKSQNDAWIVMGRDRPGHRESGYGGKGHTKASSIDMVCGRLGYEGLGVNEDGEPIYVDPDFVKDAVRFYMSQKADIDEYFRLTGYKSEGKSAAGMKADAIRIISRDGGIKLVTNVDKKNSRGGNINEIRGIELVAGNDSKSLQPMVLGDFMIEFLDALIGQVEALSAIVDGFVTEQMKFNTALMTHKHYSPFMGGPTTPSDDMLRSGIQPMMNHVAKTKQSLIAFKNNLVALRQKYLMQTGTNLVVSRWNSTN